jgi:hypothetical protein
VVGEGDLSHDAAFQKKHWRLGFLRQLSYRVQEASGPTDSRHLTSCATSLNLSTERPWDDSHPFLDFDEANPGK